MNKYNALSYNVVSFDRVLKFFSGTCGIVNVFSCQLIDGILSFILFICAKFGVESEAKVLLGVVQNRSYKEVWPKRYTYKPGKMRYMDNIWETG